MLKEITIRIIFLVSLIILFALIFNAKTILESRGDIQRKQAVTDIKSSFDSDLNCLERFANSCSVVQKFRAELDKDKLSFNNNSYTITGSEEAGFSIVELNLKVISVSDANIAYMLAYPETGKLCLDAEYTYYYNIENSEVLNQEAKTLFIDYCRDE